MDFTLGQYDYNGELKKWMKPIIKDNENNFIITASTVLAPKETVDFSSNNSSINYQNSFKDIGFKSTVNFEYGHVYYCHVAIKKEKNVGVNAPASQTYQIKLAKDTDSEKIIIIDDREDTQYIKTITISNIRNNNKNTNNEWEFIDFIFSPYDNKYNVLYFDLVRTTYDYTNETDIGRLPEIIMLEFSEIQSLQETELTIDKAFLKIGVQSAPGLRMVINDEEIYIGRTGIYEFKHPDIKISSIGIIAQAQYWTLKNNEIVEFSHIYNILTNEYKDGSIYTTDKGKNEKYINSISDYHYYQMVNDSRNFQPFTVDYVYEYTVSNASAQ